ncbi:MAG TPA: M56 family metallopeptidase [Lachnospiraceae bacterium]|nr:M56 family metallopeptidase [Lachnospiraceae bacterium]
MQELFFTYVTNTINITAVLLVILLLEPFLKKHFSAICLHRVWFILMIGLLIPIHLDFTKPIFTIRLPRISEVNRTVSDSDFVYGADTIAVRSVIQEQNEPKKISRLKISTNALTNDNTIQINEKWRTGNSFRYCMVWLSGTLLIIIVSITRYYRYIKKLRRFIEPLENESIQKELMGILQELEEETSKKRKRINGISRNVKVMHCSIIASPVTVGFIQPLILIPFTEYSRLDLHLILKHELVHYLRKDSLVKLIQLLMLSLNWYNPFCYILCSRINSWCEMSCDERVLRKQDKSVCIHYSRLLLRNASRQTSISSTLLMNFNGGKNRMKQRIYSIMDRDRKRNGGLLIALLVIIISFTAIISIGSYKEALASNRSDLSLQESINTLTGKVGNLRNDDLYAEVKNQKIASKATDVKVEEKSSVAEDDSMRESVVEYAKNEVGADYIYGGTSHSTGYDCSGLIQAIYKNIGYDLPRKSKEQAQYCKTVLENNLLPGDLVFYAKDKGEIVHVGIYIGEGKVIHAKNNRVGVVTEDMNYRTPYSFGRVIY